MTRETVDSVRATTTVMTGAGAAFVNVGVTVCT